MSVRVLEMDNSNDSGENWGKAGILAREDLTEGSRSVGSFLSTGNGTSFQWRDTADNGSGSSRIGSDIESYPYWVRLIREGSLWRGWHAADNNGTPGPWSQIGNDHTLDLPQTLYLGLAVTSHTTGTTHTDKIDNVTFLGTSWKAINPVPDGSVWIDPNVDLTLSWDQAELGPCGAGVTYDVIVGTDPDEVADSNAVPVATVTDLQHVISAAGLNYEDEIYWRVDTNYDDGVTVDSEQGDVWYFEAIKLVPAHVSEPQDVFAYPGDTVEFAFEVTSETPVTYAWFKEVDGGDVQVGTGNPVILAGVVESDDGYYYCIAENDSGPTQSASARLEVAQLIGHWKLDVIAEPNTIIDSVDTPTHGNHDGTLFGSPGLGAGVSGNPGDMALGVNIGAELMQYAVIGPVGISGTKPRTITCWAKAAVPVGEIDGWSNIFGFTSVITSGTNKSFDFNRRGGQDQYCIHVYGWERNIATIDDQWHFLAGTYDGTTVSWYNNGEFVGEDVRSGLVTEDLVHIGKRAHSEALWRGWVDDARVYNYPLDPIAIAVLYTDVTGETVCAKNPIYDFDGDCETTLADFAILAAKWMWCNLVPDCLP